MQFRKASKMCLIINILPISIILDKIIQFFHPE